MNDTKPQTAEGKVLWHFTMSLLRLATTVSTSGYKAQAGGGAPC